MANGYEINDMAKEESWRLFRIMGEMVEGFDGLSGVEPAVTIYGSARIKPNDDTLHPNRRNFPPSGGTGFLHYHRRRPRHYGSGQQRRRRSRRQIRRTEYRTAGGTGLQCLRHQSSLLSNTFLCAR